MSNLTGDWNKLANMLNPSRLKNSLRKCAAKAGNYGASEVKKGIRGGAPGGQSFAPLSPVTIINKGSSKPLIDHGDLIGSVTYEVFNDNSSVFIGVKKGKEVNIAAVHEYGCTIGVTSKMKKDYGLHSHTREAVFKSCISERRISKDDFKNLPECFTGGVFLMIVETVRALIKMLKSELCENVVLSAGNIVEISKLPVIILNGPVLQEKKRLARDPDRISVIDEENEVAVLEVPPRWYDLRFDVNISFDNSLSMLEFIEKFSILAQKNRLIKAVNDLRERQYIWAWRTLPGLDTKPNISQVFQGRGEIVIYDVEVYSGIQEVWPLIKKVNVEFNNQDTIEV